jgi:hypothetical protein
MAANMRDMAGERYGEERDIYTYGEIEREREREREKKGR